MNSCEVYILYYNREIIISDIMRAHVIKLYFITEINLTKKMKTPKHVKFLFYIYAGTKRYISC